MAVSPDTARVNAGQHGDAYSLIADEQLDALETGDDLDLYDAVLDACDLVFRATGLAQSRSTAIRTAEGVRFRLPIAGHPPYKVFWAHTEEGPRVEAVFPPPDRREVVG